MSLTLSKKAAAVKPSSTLAISAKAKAMKAEGMDVVSFGAGEPDFNTPDNISEAGIRAITEGFTKYTAASGITELKEAVCKKFEEFNKLHYEPNQVIICNGAKHCLTNVFEAILNPGDEVIILVPYWLTYPETVKLCSGVPVFVYGDKKNGYKAAIDQVSEAVTDKTKALLLNSPCNPTGMIYTEEELTAIADLAVEKDFYVISDEIYEYLTYEGKKHVSIASFGEEIYDRTITVSGVSKSYAMTGWRIGYAGAPLRVAKLMSSIQSHQTSNPNSIAQKAALEALTGDQTRLWQMHDEFDKRRKYMYGRLVKMPHISLLKPVGAFYTFIDCTKLLELSYKGEKLGTTARIGQILLSDYQVAVIPCADFGAPSHIRLSYAVSVETIEKGMKRIEDFLLSLK